MERNTKMEIESGDGKTETAEPTLGRRILNGLAYVAVMAAVLFFVAPESWWQFGVSPAAERKSATDFTLNDLNGEKWTLSEHRGKVVVVNYWATWCPPCRVETPGLVSFAGEYQPRGVEMVGVTVDEDISAVPPFAEQYNVNYRILVEGPNPNLPMDGMPLPTTFLYDKNGRLAKRYTGMVLESTLSSDVEALLAED